ncbi:MAG: penicillin acylase family protein, partial [Sphingobacteriales bacterium 12-47-4]
MRIIPFIISTALTGGLVYLLNNPIGESIPMPLGKFLSPQHGFWQNAEPADADYSTDLSLPDIEGKAEVYLDERLVPHIFADNERDAYFAQGYLHARFRLFQMDLQTLAAEGRASEIAGEKAVRFDREQRRLGMKYAAENALQAIGTSDTKFAFDAYTAGVNAYISSLTESQLPLEYKILNFKPEKWTNYRTALLLKMMAKMLSSGTESDLAHTNAKTVFSDAELKALYPQVNDSLMPIVPAGTAFATPGIVPVKPAIADSLYLDNKQAVNITEVSRPDKNNGSNNWVVSGSRTESGAPILCNDPHLELSLPSIWYELQVVTPKSNAYGVSL